MINGLKTLKARMKVQFNTLSNCRDNRSSIKARNRVKQTVQKIKCTHGGTINPIAQITFNQIIKVIAAANGADNVCADLLGSFPQINIPTWTAANNPAIGIKDGMKYPAIT